MIYENDKSHRITLRLNDNQFQYVKKSADVVGVSPSEFLRMVVNATMFADQAAKDKIAEQKGESRRENETTIQHNLV